MKRRVLAVLLAGVLAFSHMGTALSAETQASGSAATETEVVEEAAEQVETQEYEAPGTETAEQQEEEVLNPETAETGGEDAEEEPEVIEEAGDPEGGEQEGTVEDEGGSEEGEDAETAETNDPDAGLTEEAAADATEEAAAEEEPAEEETAVIEEELTEELSKEALADGEGYWIQIHDWEGPGALYSDGVWSCPLEVRGFEGTEYELQATVIGYTGPESASTNGVCWIAGEPGNERFYIDGSILKAEGITWVKVRAAGIVDGETVDQSDREFDVREPKEEYDREYDRVMLPGWDGTVNGSYDVYIENSEYPQGHNERYSVTDVEIVSDEPWEGENGSVITDFHRDQKSDDDYWWYYRVGHHGEATLKVTYEDLHGEERDYYFTLHVGGDAYSVYMDSDGGERNAFPGGRIRLYADAHHQYMDDNGGYHEDADGLQYDWFLEQGGDFARVETDADDPSKATLIFNDLPEGQNEINEHVRVGVRILDENGEETEGYDSTGFWVCSNYTEVWPLRLDWELDVGASLENVEFEVREYTYGEGDFRVLDEAYEIEYEWNYDENAVSITEMREGEPVEIHDAETAKGNVFTITRKMPWNTDYSVRAYWTDDNGHDQDCYGNYRFWNKNYDLWFEQHDVNLYTDAEEVPEGVLNVENLGEDWQNRLDLELIVGYWDHDNWYGMLDAADYTAVNDGGEVRVALTKAYLATLEDHTDVRIEARLFPKGAANTDDNCIADTDMWFHIQMAKEEYDREYDRTMLPGWDGSVNGSYNVYIENSEDPNGHDERYYVTDVEIVSDEPWEGENGDVIEEFHRDQNSEEDYWWYYRVEHRGEATLKVTYEDIHGEEKSYEFKIYVGDDVYRVDMDSDEGIRNAFPGGEIELYANAFHEYYDEYGQYHNDWNKDVGFRWTIEQGEEYAWIEVDENAPSWAILKFNDLPDGWDRIDEHVRVGVRVLDKDGNETEAFTSVGFWVRTDYTEVWPLELDTWIDAGASHEDIKFEVRRYTFGEEDDYQVLDEDFEVRYEWHYDENAVSVTETVGDSAVTVPDGEAGAGHIFTITRRQSWHTDYSVRAFWNENGEDRDVWSNYRFDDINYDFWFDIDGNDAIFSDGEREFGFNLENVSGSDFELVPEIGNGEWSEENGFAEPIAEGSCWTYDSRFHKITFDGEALRAAGIDHFSTRVSLLVNGIEVRDIWRDFHVEDPQYDFWGLGDEVLFIDENRYWNRNGGGFVRNNWYPDGQDITYSITSLEYASDEDPFDTRDALEVTDDGNGWNFHAVRGGEMEVFVTLQIDDGVVIRATHNYETSYRFIVGGFRAGLGLYTDTGSDRLQSGGEITVYPEIYAEEYDWETGEHRQVDPEAFMIRYDVRCDRLADRLVDELYGGDFERAAARGDLWDYVENLDGSIRLKSYNDQVYEMELVVEAALVDKETDNEVAHASYRIFVDRVIMALLLIDDQGHEKSWNEAMVPGEIVQITPRLMRKAADAGYTPVSDYTEVLYKLDWYTGGGENDPAHIEVWDQYHLLLDPGAWITEDNFPLEVKRLTEGDFTFSIEAQWKDDEGRDQGISRQLHCENEHYSDGFNRNNDRGNYGYTWYYTAEEISITPDRAKLDELIAAEYPVDLTVEMGILGEDDTIEPIINYEIGEDGHRGQELGEYDISAIFSEQTGLHVSGEALEDLEKMLRYQYNEWGEDYAVLFLKFHSELNGFTFVDHILRIEIANPYLTLTDFRWDMGVGQTKTWENGQAELYLEDVEHDRGENFDITITDIALRNQEDSEYVGLSKDGEDWTLTALKVSDSPIPLTFTFTGGPEGYDTLEGRVTVSEGVFDLEFRDADEKKVDDLWMLIGETHKVIPYVTYTEGETVTVLSPVKENGYYYKVRGDINYDDHVINYNKETGDVAGIQNGSTNLQMVIDVYDENDEPCYALWTFAEIRVSSNRAELSVPEDAVFHVKPGQTYTAQEIVEAIGPTLTVYSMKEPEGKEYPISGYGFEEVIGEEGKLLLSEMADGAFRKLSVDAAASEGEAILILQAWEEHGARASAGCKLIIECANMPQEIDCDTSTPVVNQKTLKYTVTGAQGKLTFAIADTSVATVEVKNGDENGDEDSDEVTVKGLKPGITKLIVTAAASDGYEATEKEFEIRVVPGATKQVRATNLADCMKITWQKVEGAKKYDVYRDGEYLLTTSLLYCPDKDARYKNLQKFTYKVIAYTIVDGVRLESTEARTTTYYRVMTVGVNKLTNTETGKLKVTYTTNPASTGYVVRYGKKADMSDGKTKTIFGANTNSYTITGVKKGTTYYVQVRTFVRKPVEGGGTFDYFSTYSTIKNLKITN